MHKALKHAVKYILNSWNCSVSDKEVRVRGFTLGACGRVVEMGAVLDVVARCGDKVVVVEVERALVPLFTIDDTAAQCIAHRIAAAALTLNAYAFFILTPSVDAYRGQVSVAREVVRRVSGKDMDMRVFIVKNIVEFERELKKLLNIESPEMKYVAISIERFGIKKVVLRRGEGIRKFNRKITEYMKEEPKVIQLAKPKPLPEKVPKLLWKPPNYCVE
jgi:hypothetical protein